MAPTTLRASPSQCSRLCSFLPAKPLFPPTPISALHVTAGETILLFLYHGMSSSRAFSLSHFGLFFADVARSRSVYCDLCAPMVWSSLVMLEAMDVGQMERQ
ncbi:hypothetical protein PIB30_027779 [Stylosanthes scabra]|uniref:Uncharacterized protein n=1 Tax=Stylosanthes scabra TaxID=79078 RepID=A0ABU6QAZ8_9FABA|nr:hypothetical protein [Stylosanthes scabra]